MRSILKFLYEIQNCRQEYKPKKPATVTIVRILHDSHTNDQQERSNNNQ